MSWLSRLLGRKAADTTLQTLEALAAAAKDIHEFRTAAATAAQRGDLDDIFSRLDKEKKKTDEWLDSLK